MAINPPSDIVLDVARAADPARRQAATNRLAGLAAPEAGEAPRFTGMVDRLHADAATCAPRPFAGGPSPARGTAPDAYRAFEAFFLQSFIQSMLPKATEATYGGGTAGDVWRSMSAEQLGQSIAGAGGIGIAERLLAQAAGLREPARESASEFSLASLSGGGAIRDWASYLPFLEARYASGILSRPASPAALLNDAPDAI